MTGDEMIGFIGTPETMEKYFLRVMEAEKKLGPLSREEKIIILKSLASPVTLDELTDMMAGKRVLVIKDKNEKHS
jgi:hypothetical protein